MSPDKAHQSVSEGVLQQLGKMTPKKVLTVATAAALSNADVREGVMNALVPTAHATEISAPSDFGSEYIPSGGLGCLLSVVPHDLTGSYGFRADLCEGTTEVTTDGSTFSDERATMATAITSGGGSIDGTYLVPCDYSDSFDEVLVTDALTATAFVLEGYSSGITGVKQLQGSIEGCGSIDETYGTYHLPADTRGFVEIHEFSETASPTPVYAYGTDDIHNTTLNVGTDMAVFTDSNDTSTHFVENASSGSSATVTPFGIDGYTAGMFEAHETGGNKTVLLSDGSTLQFVELTESSGSGSGGTDTGDTGDTAAPEPVDADSDGYTEDEECDDTNASVNPAASEVCNDIDDNCDGVTDTDAIDKTTWYRDADGDGVGNSSSTQEACDAPSGYVSSGGDYDDSDPTVQLEPVPTEDCDSQSAGGSFEEGEMVCALNGEGLVYMGDVEYNELSNWTVMEDAQDWIEFVDALPMDSSTYNGIRLIPEIGSRGGYVLAITDSEMENLYVAPPSEGDNIATIRVDAGSVVLEDLNAGTSEELGVGTHEVEGEPYEEEVPNTDADGDGVLDQDDAFPNDPNESMDSDRDGTGNNADDDDDNDGYTDEEEAEAGTDPLSDASHPVEGGEDSGDTHEPIGNDDTAGQDWELPGEDPTGCNCASTDIDPLSSPMPWVMAAGLLAVRGRRKRN